MNERTIIFSGPTIPRKDIEEILPQALVMPPAELGDMDFAVTHFGAHVIGIIDGVHRTRLPISQREIMLALEKGVRVFGAASMGALRAVECAPWGAEPIGQIARWYTEGVIDGDDEVCVAHADESMEWRTLSTPLVNIRATLIAAETPEDRAEEIIAAAKAIFYPDRLWARVFDACEVRGKEAEHILEHEIDLKYADALHLCYTIAKLPERKQPERKVRNLRDGFGAVFGVNDRKIMHNGKIMRLYELADGIPQTSRWAAERQLALEFCKLAGIEPLEKVTSVNGLPYDDLEDEDRIRLANEERTLSRAREWLSSSRANFWDVSDCTDWLRVNYLYQARKKALL